MDKENKVMKFKVLKEQIGIRLDKFLTGQLPGFSRSQIQKMIKNNLVTVNGKIVPAHYFLREGEIIIISNQKSDNRKKKKEKTKLPRIKVVTETSGYLVINKPAGLLVHPNEIQKSGTLVDWLVKRYPAIKKIYDRQDKVGQLRPGIVHRLDRDVSGLMVIAKTQKMYDWLKKQFQERQVEKIYTALVYGVIKPDAGLIKRPIARAKNKSLMVVRTDEMAEENSKEAITQFEVIKRFKNYTLLKITLQTGRTHQIRVHLKSIGHSVVGDTLYETRDLKHKKNKIILPRLFLCAVNLGFHDLTNNWQEYKIKLPVNLTKFLKGLK